MIIPFAGDSIDAGRLLRSLSALRTAQRDELIIVDNSAHAVMESVAAADERVRVVRAIDERSSYYARNAGADVATRGWLLFIDSDCVPVPDILDKYFREVPAEECGAVAGEILSDVDQESVAARWAGSRERLRQVCSLANHFRPFGSTANLLVRKVAFDRLTGFTEGLRSGGDADFCWRLQLERFTLEYREHAYVRHSHRESVSDLLRQSVHYGGSQGWLKRRFQAPLPPGRMLRQVILILRGAVALLTFRFEDARYFGLDIADLGAQALGSRGGNWPRGATRSAGGEKLDTIVYLEFPSADAPEGRTMDGWPGSARVEALRRPWPPRAEEVRGLRVSYAEDYPRYAQLQAAARIVARDPASAIGTWRRARGKEPELGGSFLAVAAAAHRTSQAGGRVRAGERASEELADAIATLSIREPSAAE